jgi:hypothetical protein
VFSSRIGTLSNDFFVNLLSMATVWTASADGSDSFEGRDRASGELRWRATRVDLVFGSNAELRAELAEAYVGRSLAHWDFVIDPGFGEPSHLVANILRALRSLPADWMRTEAMRRLHSDPSTTQYSPAIFATKVPMPQELKHYRYYDPHTRSNSGGLSSAQLEVGVTTVRAARGVTQLFGVVHILLERLEKEIDLAASAAMPSRMFATRYWCHWFDQYGIVSFRRK